MASEVTQQTIASDDSDTFHPDFRSPSSDFIIISSDGVHFRVHRFLLQESSPVFSDMLTLPQPTPAPDTCLSLPSVSLPEDSEVVVALLRLTYPVPPPSFSDIDTISKVLFAAQKYEMGSVVTSLRRILFEEEFLETDPMTLYAIAQRLGWKYEAHLASYNSLKFNLFDPENLAILSKPGFSSADLAQLFSLHHNRIEKMRLGLNRSVELIICWSCEQPLPEGPWLRLKTLILEEMGKRPLGDGIFRVRFLSRHDVKSLWATTCTCRTKNYETVTVLTKIMDLLNKLPACACKSCDFPSDSTKEKLLLRY